MLIANASILATDVPTLPRLSARDIYAHPGPTVQQEPTFESTAVEEDNKKR